jgi:hypothetical protein
MLPRHELPDQRLDLAKLGLGVGLRVEHVERPARDAFEEQDFTRTRLRQRGDHEQLADPRDDVRGHAGDIVRRDAAGEHERKRAHRLIVGRAGGVAFEQMRDRPLAGGDHHQVAVGGISLELGNADLGDLDRAAALRDEIHEARELQPLIDRLRRRVELADEAERLVAGSVRRRQRDTNAVNRGRGFVPQVEPEPALLGTRRPEHALARQHLAAGDIGRGAILRKTDLAAGVEQTDGEHESGLAAAHDGDVTHGCLSAMVRSSDNHNASLWRGK